MKVNCFFDHVEVLGDDFGVISVSCWRHFGIILEACWGHFGVIFGFWGFLGPQEASKRPSGRKTKIFRRMAPAKVPDKLGLFFGPKYLKSLCWRCCFGDLFPSCIFVTK